MIKKIILILTLIVVSSCCKKELTDSITFTQKGLYPEGLEYDRESKLFYVTSLTTGNVGRVKIDGSYIPFIQDETLVSAIGLRLDRERNRILVCNSDPGTSVKTKPETQKKLAGLGIYDFKTAKKIAYVDLGSLQEGAHFCNDIALDKDGNIYVTDSFSPIIYKIDIENKPSILLTDKKFEGEGFNLNGIVVHPDGYLIVAMNSSGILYKVSLSNPSEFSEISIPEKVYGDGLHWGDNGQLYVNSNGNINKIFLLESKDAWKTANIFNKVDTGETFVTTGVKTEKGNYVLYSMLNKLFDPNNKVPQETFTIQRVILK